MNLLCERLKVTYNCDFKMINRRSICGNIRFRTWCGRKLQCNGGIPIIFQRYFFSSKRGFLIFRDQNILRQFIDDDTCTYLTRAAILTYGLNRGYIPKSSFFPRFTPKGWIVKVFSILILRVDSYQKITNLSFLSNFSNRRSKLLKSCGSADIPCVRGLNFGLSTQLRW